MPNEMDEKYNEKFVLSNGYKPKMFLQAYELHVNKPFEKFINTTDIDIERIEYLEKFLKRRVDIYTSYMNKDYESSYKLLGDILAGLVCLKEGGVILFNMKTFFKPFYFSLLGFLSDMFESFSITKPYTSTLTNSEVYIIGKGYNRDDKKIDLLKDIFIKMNKDNELKYSMIPGSINVKKYSCLLLAAYTYYGRQIYFMEKDIELCNRLYSIYKTNKDITENSLLNSNDKFVKYYTRMRLDICKKIRNVQELFDVRKV